MLLKPLRTQTFNVAARPQPAVPNGTHVEARQPHVHRTHTNAAAAGVKMSKKVAHRGRRWSGGGGGLYGK